jgi:chemotaxis protein methyltransferase CheR
MLDCLSSPQPVPPLEPNLLLRFANLVYDQFGLVFPEARLSMLGECIRSGYAASTCATLMEYFELLKDKDGAVDRERLANSLTLTESYFYRDRAQFDALSTEVLPRIIERRRMLRTLRLWSAGCGGGEEPYSLAMLLSELVPDKESWTIQILATDINTRSLDQARQGFYRDWAFRDEHAHNLRQRYFDPVEGGYQVKAELRQMVAFEYLNLFDIHYPSFETNTRFVDLILCRNVITSFSEAGAHQVLDRIYDALGPGGWLGMGQSEYIPNTFQRLTAYPVGNSIFYRRSVDVLNAPRNPQPPPRSGSGRLVKMGVSGPLNPGALIQQTRELDPLRIAQDLFAFGHAQKALDLLCGLVNDSAVPSTAGRLALTGLMGEVYASLNDWAGASRWLMETIKSDPQDPEPCYTLALVLQHQQETLKAIEVMKRVIQLDPRHVLGHFGLANLYQSAGCQPEARDALEKTLHLLHDLPYDGMLPGRSAVSVTTLREVSLRMQQKLANRPAGSQK